MQVCITVDVEQDCPPYLSTLRGMQEGMPLLAALFQHKQIPATLFTTGQMARQFPSLIQSLVHAGHELGCHGDTHRRFDSMNMDEAREEIEAASKTLREFTDVISFRAPNLAFPAEYLDLLVGAGYRLDSSQGKHKAEYWSRPARQSRARTPRPCASSIAPCLARIPASITSSWLRLPRFLRTLLLGRLRSPVVLFVHPWEFVDLRQERLRWDCRARTGPMALQCLSEVIDFFRDRSAQFVRMRDLLPSNAS